MMTKWKIYRQEFGNEEFEFEEGEQVAVGRGLDNKIMLSSIVVSRYHCVLKVQKDNILITDLNSSNGTYVGTNKIPMRSTFTAKDGDIIGFGWTTHVGNFKDITDNDKHVFRLVKANESIANRIQYVSDSDDNLEAKIATLFPKKDESLADILKKETDSKNLKRKSYDTVDTAPIKIKKELVKSNEEISLKDVNVVNLLSDSDSEVTISVPNKNQHVNKIQLDLIHEEPLVQCIKEEKTKFDNESPEYEAFDVKQEYFGFDDDEAIQIDSDSDSDSDQWLLRLSQTSPGKPFIRRSHVVPQQENTSYSQIEDPELELDNEINDEEECYDDIIKIPPQHEIRDTDEKSLKKDEESEIPHQAINFETDDEEILNDIITFNLPESSFKPLELPKVSLEHPKESLELPKESLELPKETLELSKESLELPRLALELLKDPVELPKDHDLDTVDGDSYIPAKPVVENLVETGKKAQMIEPLLQLPRRKAHVASSTECKPRATLKSTLSSSSKRSRSSKRSSSKSHISDTQKEERKKRLKELAKKDKNDSGHTSNKSSNETNKVKVNAKITSASKNRGAFLTDVAQAVVKPVARKDSPEKPCKSKEKKKGILPRSIDNSEKSQIKKEKDSPELEKLKHKSDQQSKMDNQLPRIPLKSAKPLSEREETGKPTSKVDPDNSEKSQIKKEKDATELEKLEHKSHQQSKIDKQLPRIPLKSVKPLSESEETGKPTSKVDPMPPKKIKKSVRFSNAPPEVHTFEIEPGHRLNKTSSIKITFDKRQRPVFSLEKLTLMKILRWNPHWLDEQINNNDPPPILGHNNNALGMFQAFETHHQYVGQVGDLLLMEIWECISQGYMRVRHQKNGVPMKIVSLPPAPPQDRTYDIFNITVEIALPVSDMKNMPRMGEIMLVYFGPEDAKCSRFLFVTNVLQPNNRRKFYTVNLHATFTEKMRSLQPGEVMMGKSLAHIHKELTLFEAMEYLAGSPLSEAILRPEPHHFPEITHNEECSMNSQWTKDLNESQKAAVSASVSAALSDRPNIQMVQGPPGTGKSSVICAMVMAYFYDAAARRQAQRGKILICATSNAAVDELVLRLLNIRQNLPRDERFRMVRVGRLEAMHARARDVSSQTLAQRDARPRADPPAPALREEISRLTAKINKWISMMHDAKDPPRVAYCEDRIRQFESKRKMLGGGEAAGGEAPRPEDVARAERRIIDCADIVLTTLASAVNQKMRGLKRRIALCIVDEAGQAIEPETLIPLTLDVTRLALIGDPQQLPGYICSQRAKRHGLGESLFARLAGAAEGGAVLLDRQYRMHAAIADYPNRAFYAGRVRSSPAPRPPLPVPPYAILTISSGDKGQGAAGGNEMEAWGVARVVVALRDVARKFSLSLAVITPYHAHKELLKRNLRALCNDPSEPGVEVNTIDSFQGQERDIVVVSLARSHGVGFLTDAGRLNVMLTRARHALLVALNPHAVMRNDQWRTLVEDAQRRHVLRALPLKLCQPLAPGQSPLDVLGYLQ